MQEIQERWVWSLDQEDPLDMEIATHSSILAWEIPWREEPGRLQSMGLLRVGHHLAHTQGWLSPPGNDSIDFLLWKKIDNKNFRKALQCWLYFFLPHAFTMLFSLARHFVTDYLNETTLVKTNGRKMLSVMAWILLFVDMPNCRIIQCFLSPKGMSDFVCTVPKVKKHPTMKSHILKVYL